MFDRASVWVAVLFFSGFGQASAAVNRVADQERLSSTYEKCMKASGGATAGMRDCAGIEWQRLTKVIDERVRRLATSVDNSYVRADVLKAQRSWRSYVDSECNVQGWTSQGEGTLGPVVSDDCGLEMAIKRADALRDELRDIELGETIQRPGHR